MPRHKYDPISQEEYFRFFAILNNTARCGSRRRVRRRWSRSRTERDRQRQAEIADSRSPSWNKRCGEATAGGHRPSEQQLEELCRSNWRRSRGSPTPILRELPADKRRQDPHPDPRQFPESGRRSHARRARGLPSAARWTSNPIDWRWHAGWSTTRNPADRRVVVNRYWEQLFGIGLVRDQRGFRLAGRTAVASRAARLAGHRTDATAAGTPSGCCSCSSLRRRIASRRVTTDELAGTRSATTACWPAGRDSACRPR